ncbi:hypothetical protein ZHAS_00012214 [Anopheles sinensis]|uniref:Uncharacterized protein n=1 Tax=Anopheles sinensis TaxID=74873 RepID=A0A084W2I7_ANOSI|nr:hypothetical protein ZHAS_00012214 [Anopheles sinensis]
MRSFAVLLLAVCSLLSHWDFLLAVDNHRLWQEPEWTARSLPGSFPVEELVTLVGTSIAEVEISRAKVLKDNAANTVKNNGDFSLT